MKISVPSQAKFLNVNLLENSPGVMSVISANVILTSGFSISLNRREKSTGKTKCQTAILTKTRSVGEIIENDV